MKPKVLIVTMYQPDEPGIEGGQGEASLWIEHWALRPGLTLAGNAHGVYTNQDQTVSLIVTGVGKANAATSLMRVGMHPEIDLSQAYIIVCGIAGANPEEVSVGSPVWCNAVVDGDLASYVSMPELEGLRRFPFFPMGTTGGADEEPYASGTEVYHLNGDLVDRACSLTREVELVDDTSSAAYRSAYRTWPAIQPPFVYRGGFLSSDTFIHGNVTGKWSEEWFRHWAGSESKYVLGNQEDSGTLTALKTLSEMGRVQWDRILLLRAGSNYDRPAPGVTALDSLRSSISDGVPVAMHIALQNTFIVANRFIEGIVF